MTTSLERYTYEPTSIEQGFKLAETIKRSSLAPAGLQAPDILLVMATGRSYGWDTMKSLRSLYVVKGRVCMYADAIVGLVKASQECEYFMVVETTPETCTVETKRAGSPAPERITWSMDDAKRAGLWGQRGPWTSYPADMLRARASARLARAVYPDVVAGIYDPEEICEVREEPCVGTAVVVDDEVVVIDAPVDRWVETRAAYREKSSQALDGLDVPAAKEKAIMMMIDTRAFDDDLESHDTAENILRTLVGGELRRTKTSPADIGVEHVVAALAEFGVELERRRSS